MSYCIIVISFMLSSHIGLAKEDSTKVRAINKASIKFFDAKKIVDTRVNVKSKKKNQSKNISARLGRVRIRITGQSTKLKKLSFVGRKFFVIKKNKVLSYKAKAKTKGKRNKIFKIKDKFIKSKYLGLFKYELTLPRANIHLPLRAEFIDGTKKIYLVKLDVKKMKVDTEKNKYEKSPFQRKYNQAWLALGISQLNYSQDTGSGLFNLGFDSNFTPALTINRAINREWEVLASYSKTDGEFSSSSGVNVNSPNYSFSVLKIDGVWNVPGYRGKLQRLFNKIIMAKYSLLFGLQQHSAPFFTRSPSVLNVGVNHITMANVGGLVRFVMDYKWAFEFNLNMQIPVSGAENFDINSTQSIDGSIGFYHKLNDRVRIGGSWYGRSQKINFSNASDIFDSNFSGTQILNYSIFEFRVGYEW